jgi:ribosomal protein S18 acetylase RimI-like enzyme
MIVFTNDKQRLQRHFEKDPVLFAYHLGDLDDFHFEFCQWVSIYGARPHIEDLVLIYTGLAVPTVLAFGVSDRFPELMNEVVDLLPDYFHGHFHPAALDILQTRYTYEPFGTHLKMALESFVPAHDENIRAGMRRLDNSDIEQLHNLYKSAYPGNYFTDRMLESGKYLGYECDGRLVAVAGVHVDSTEYRIAALGNVATRPEYRGRGIATGLISVLVEELLTEKKRVCLNVKADNHSAIRCYEKLGFVTAHEYHEGHFSLIS